MANPRTTARHGFKFVVDNKMRGAFGETNFNTKVVRINKKMHRKAKKTKGRYGISKKDCTLINTIVHEQMHIDHPKMHERTVEKRSRAKAARMGKRAKQRMYNKLKTK